LPAGSYQFTATYSGDSNYNGSSTPGPELMTINKGSPSTATTILDSSGGEVTGVLGESVFDTATVNARPAAFTPTGTVLYEFFTNGTGSGTPSTTQTVTLSDGTVPDSATQGPLAAGSYSFIAIYSGDSNYARSMSPVEPLIVVPPLAPPSVTSLQRFGYHEKPTRLVLTFSSALDPSRAQDAQNYTLTPIGKNGHVGKRIRIASAVYATVADTVTLHFTKLLYLFQRYKLVVNGMAPSGLAGPTGVLLDGLGNGIPGSDYVRVFGPRILAGPYPRASRRSIHDVRHFARHSAHSMTRIPRLADASSSMRRARTGLAMVKAGPDRMRVNAVDAVLAPNDLFPRDEKHVAVLMDENRRKNAGQRRGQDRDHRGFGQK
jgi:hypothetical protein